MYIYIYIHIFTCVYVYIYIYIGIIHVKPQHQQHTLYSNTGSI